MARKTPATGEKWLTTGEASDLTGIAVQTFKKWRYQGGGPRYLKLGTDPNAAIRYRLRDIEAWGEACRKDTAA
jgi:predicted DNA-binding transcriptional regulator AlpA